MDEADGTTMDAIVTNWCEVSGFGMSSSTFDSSSGLRSFKEQPIKLIDTWMPSKTKELLAEVWHPP